jgi:hypothetical protein
MTVVPRLQAYRAALEFLKQLPAWCGDDEVLLCAYLEGKMLQKADAEGSRTAASTIILLITSDRNLRTFKVSARGTHTFFWHIVWCALKSTNQNAERQLLYSCAAVQR